MKTASQKIVEEWKNEKKKVKKVSYYKNILSQENKKIVEKIYKVLEIIKEEMVLSTNYEEYEKPFIVDIDESKLLENKILVSDFKKIIGLLRLYMYAVIPRNKEWFSHKEIEEIGEKIIFILPIGGWCNVTQDECFKYPYEQNFINFNKAIEEIMHPKENLKNDNHHIIFNKNTGVLKISNKSLKFRKFTNQYYLLEIILKDKESRDKDWQFSEISEDVEYPLENYDDKKLYNVANAIKHKIAEKIGIEDFFITTIHSIKINKKCFKKS